MIFPDSMRLAFIEVCIALIGLMVFLTVRMYKKKNEYRLYITLPIVTGIYAIVSYCFFLLFSTPEGYKGALFFCTLFYIATDWLALFMFIFAVSYTGIFIEHRKKFFIIFSIFSGVDTLDLLVNLVTKHMYDLVFMERMGVNGYWGNEFCFPHYLHLGFCYIMVFLTFVFMGISVLNSAKVYKRKYTGIFIVYFIVILLNMVSYSLNLPLDCSVILYGVLASFICYYSTYSYPHQLLTQSLTAVNETISDAIMYFDLNESCIYANKVAKKLFSDENGFSTVLAERYRRKCITKLEMDAGSSILKDTFVINDTTYHYEVEYQKEYDENNEIGSYLKMADRTIAVNDFEKERYIATHDDLTGILNRTGFFEEVDEYAKRYGLDNRVMICSNIKDFKLINELFGEKVGDDVLKRQAELFTVYAHENTVFGRICDDRFALFVNKNYISEADIKNYINSLKKMTESPVYQMHVYVGVYEPSNRYETAQEMYDKATMAIDEISEEYTEVFSYYNSSVMERLLDERNITEAFPHALESGEIEMHLQPIIDTKQASFGAEALCRWNHPLRGLLRPVSFLNVLEKSGLIFQLDEFIWESAAKKLHEWALKGINNCYISVNVSVKDFFYTDIYKTFTRLVEKYDINPDSLHIEITETVLMTDFDKSLQLSQKLQKFGFHVSIDNFGNGYSSLNMLKDFKAGTLKIDMAFLKNTNTEHRNQIILETIISMARDLDMNVVGEGVEKQDQYDVLLKYGCTAIQGNYLSAPLSVEEYEDKFIKYFYKIN